MITLGPSPLDTLETSQPSRGIFHRWRPLLWLALGGVAVLQVYYVREMLAALVLFTIVFVIVAIITGLVYLVGRAGETTISMAEPVARRGLVLAEGISKRAFHRPHSAPAP